MQPSSGPAVLPPDAGTAPLALGKIRVKWLWVEKVVCRAISAKDRSVAHSRCANVLFLELSQRRQMAPGRRRCERSDRPGRVVSAI